MVMLKRTEIPLEENEFQELLAKGLIKQCPSQRDELAMMLGVSMESTPDEVSSFEVEQSVVDDLLKKAKFEPRSAHYTKLRGTYNHLTNQYSKEIHVSQSGIYIKVLHNSLFTEVGFYFESNALNTLEENLKHSGVEVNRDLGTVNVPFFRTNWDNRQDHYDYVTLNMANFSQWLVSIFHTLIYPMQ